MKYFTPEEYVLYKAYTQPDVFVCKTEEQTAIKVLDNLFDNYYNFDRGLETVEQALIYRDFDLEKASEVSEEPGFSWGFTEVIEKYDGSGVMGKQKSITVPNTKKHLHPEIIHWVECNPTFTLNAEFTKGRSIVYKDGFAETFGVEWAHAATYYYTSVLGLLLHNTPVFLESVHSSDRTVRADKFVEDTLTMLVDKIKKIGGLE